MTNPDLKHMVVITTGDDGPEPVGLFHYRDHAETAAATMRALGISEEVRVWNFVAVTYEEWYQQELPDRFEHLLSAPPEDDEATPDPGDYVISASGPLGSRTALAKLDDEFIGTFPSDADAIKYARNQMEEEQVWPDIWHLSDHGNWLLLNASDYGEDTD